MTNVFNNTTVSRASQKKTSFRKMNFDIHELRFPNVITANRVNKIIISIVTFSDMQRLQIFQKRR